MDAYTGEIRIFAGNFAPVNWAICNGQLLPISSNTPLFSLLGTTYGGNGTTTFALPNLQNRVPIGAGQGAGLTQRFLGEIAGQENYVLKNVPAHSHSFFGVAEGNNAPSPAGAYCSSNPGARGSQRSHYKADSTTLTTNGKMDAAMVGSNNTNPPTPAPNIQPCLGVTYIICVRGNFPPRP